MKKLIKSYTFNAINKTITFADDVSLEDVLIITNVTTNTIIYNFADINAGGTMADNVLTLDYDTTSMNDTDNLQIFIDVEDISSKDLYTLMAYFLDRLEFGLMTDNAKRLKVNIDTGTLPTVSTVTTLTTLTNLANVGNIPAQRQVESTLDIAFANGITNNITF